MIGRSALTAVLKLGSHCVCLRVSRQQQHHNVENNNYKTSRYVWAEKRMEICEIGACGRE